MISFFTGVPGSGKTYYAVDKIYNNFSTQPDAKKDNKATYENCFTNINEFNFEKVENCFYLDFDKLKIILVELHKLYKAKKSDEDLINYCKDNNIHNSLFVIDEAHNYFDSKDIVLVWWLSYHRHLYHEIILITQNLTLIDSKYKSFSEFFYKAFPQSLTLIKTHFKYNVYCNSRMGANSKSGTIKIKRNKKVFELYKSGDSINTSNIILKFLMFASLLAVLLIGIFYLYSRSLQGDSLPSVDTVDTSPGAAQNLTNHLINSQDDNFIQDTSINTDYTSKRFFNLTCNNSNCYNKNVQIPPNLLELFIKDKSVNLLYSNKINKNYYVYYLSCTDDFYQFISTKGSQNENVSNVHSPVSAPSFFTGK